MKLLLWLVTGVVITVMLVVLFVPAVRSSVEAYVLSWLARLAG